MISNVNSAPFLTRLLAQQPLIQARPLVVLDAGCSGGIADVWNNFRPSLIAHGFDPQASECRRLQERETLPTVEYHVAWLVGDKTGRARQPADSLAELRENYHNATLFSNMVANAPDILPQQSNPVAEDLAPRDQTIYLPDFVAAKGLSWVDFVKIDVDGPDYDILRSLLPHAREWGIQGFCCEVNFVGSGAADANSFHNMDRDLRDCGYILADMDIARYSTADLPAPFTYPIAAQTLYGRPRQGDAVYLRDYTSDFYRSYWPEDPQVEQLLKAICLYEIFNLPDMAVGAIKKWTGLLRTIADEPTISAMLDMLTPQYKRLPKKYEDYMAAFRDQIALFLPPSPPASKIKREG